MSILLLISAILAVEPSRKAKARAIDNDDNVISKVINSKISDYIKGDKANDSVKDMGSNQKQLYDYRTIDLDTLVMYLLLPVVNIALIMLAFLFLFN